MSNNDHAQSDLVIVDRMEDSPFDIATVCSTSLVPQPCTHVGYTDYTKPDQPQEVTQSRVTQSHASKERQSGTRKQYYTKSMHGTKDTLG